MTTKEEILDYATNTPENTNRNVLNSMLDEYNSGGSGGDSGGGGSGGEAALIVHMVNQNPNTRKAQEPGGALRADPTGTWLDAKGEDIMAALMAGRGIWLEASVEGALEYSPLALAAKNPTENEATSLAFIFSIAGTESYFSGLPNEYPVIG